MPVGQIVGYVGPEIPGQAGARRLQDWNGTVIGCCRMTISWLTPNRQGLRPRMWQVYAKVDGKFYQGRGLGERQLVKLSPVGKDNEVARRLHWPMSSAPKVFSTGEGK